MQPIPEPHLLDPDRLLQNQRGDFPQINDDHRTRADLLDKALHETCGYGRQLWENLDAVRQYLWDSLPADPRSPGPHPSLAAHPTGPADEDGWRNWIAAYASVTSVLCGPQGDSGFGINEAEHAARLRRTAPNVKVLATHPDVVAPADPPPSAAPARTAARDNTTAAPGSSMMRVLGVAVLVLLAIRGLRPGRVRAGY